MFLFDWMYGVLGWLGLYQKSARILFLGLDNAGKTTLLYMLRDGKMGAHDPTGHPTMEELVVGQVRFKTFDLGGHPSARRLWKDYFTGVDAVIYLVDANDRKRFGESCKELNALLTDEDLAQAPFLILGNKIDLPSAASEDELRTALGIHNLTTGKEASPERAGLRPIEIFMCSVLKRQGFREGFLWLTSKLN